VARGDGKHRLRLKMSSRPGSQCRRCEATEGRIRHKRRSEGQDRSVRNPGGSPGVVYVMKVFAIATLAALMACTTSGQPDRPSPSSPEATSPVTATAHQTFVLSVGHNRLNLEPRVVSLGDVVVCDGMRLRVPGGGKHRGASGEVWVNTSTTGSVSMGCRTQVAWGHRGVSY
jgi:hypothetical protein